MTDPVEVMAKAMIGDERYDTLPKIATYLERKSMAHGAEWSDRDELHADLERALSALDAAGYAVVPKEPTEAMLEACWPLYHPWGVNAPTSEDRPGLFALMKDRKIADWNAMLTAAQEKK